MPFTFRPVTIRREDAELVLRGRVVSGAYFGPETVVLRSKAGGEHATHIHSHALESPRGWPILPEHSSTILILHIPAPPPDFEIDVVTGVGAIMTATERVDITHVLDEPEFWATQVAIIQPTESLFENPALELLGVTEDARNEWYRTRIECHLQDGRWPYVRLPLPGARYIEMELAEGAEYQERVWIGQLSGAPRVLLGYHSGHFSLPALRVDEVTRVAAETDFGASNLLWLSTAYLEGNARPRELVSRLVSRVPGLRRGKEAVLSEALLENLTIDGLEWTLDPRLGWINNGEYSQRNPQSRLSILTPADFTYVRQFFP